MVIHTISSLEGGFSRSSILALLVKIGWSPTSSGPSLATESELTKNSWCQPLFTAESGLASITAAKMVAPQSTSLQRSRQHWFSIKASPILWKIPDQSSSFAFIPYSSRSTITIFGLFPIWPRLCLTESLSKSELVNYLKNNNNNFSFINRQFFITIFF